MSYKLKTVKRSLKSLNKNNFSQIQKRVSQTNVLLQSVQVHALSHPSTSAFEQERTILEKWNYLRDIEESYYKQRSRINWLSVGDQSTAFFFRTTKARNAFNAIRSFTAISGDIITDPEEVSNLAVQHFKEILSPQFLPEILITPQWFQSLSSFCCPENLRVLMQSIPSREEIESVIRKLNPSKSPGPDGFTSAFFKSAWSIVGKESVDAIMQFFHSSFMPKASNSTILALVPKKPGATLVSDYRPISCCNTLYKVVSKLLVNRLKPMLPLLIQPNQTAVSKAWAFLTHSFAGFKLVSVQLPS